MPENRIVIFNLPFPLLLPDSASLDDNAGELAPEIYVAGSPPVAIRTVLMSSAGGSFSAWGELDGGDPYGRVSFTRVQVRFNAETNHEVQEWSSDELIECAVARCNSLVSHYRDVTDQPVMTELSVPDLVHFWIIDEEPGVEARPQTLARGRGPLRVGISDAERQADAALRARLQTGSPVRFLRRVELDTRRHLVGGDYHLVVIGAALYFEAFAKRLVRQRLLKAGVPPDDVEARFVQGDRPRSIWWIAKHLIPEACGIDFVETDEGKAWASHVKDARNRIVHGEKEEVTLREAQAAINALRAALKLLPEISPDG